jgi:D-alanine transaminase
MSRIAYVNGRYAPLRDASVNIEDRGYQFADGVYEVIYVHRGRLIDEDRHLDRLERSLRELRIVQPMRRESLRCVLREVASRNRVTDGIIYMQVSRGVARRDHAFPAALTPPSIVITARSGPTFPAASGAWTVQAITQPDIRWGRVDIKTVGLLPNVLAKQAAREKGAGEAILIDRDGTVTEGSSTNVWIVDAKGVLRTRHLDNAILAGCTRGAVIALMADAGMRFEERAFSIDDLRAAQEVFITSATSFVRAVTSVDGATVGGGTPGPVTAALFDLFSRHVRGDRRNAA